MLESINLTITTIITTTIISMAVIIFVISIISKNNAK